MPKEIMNVTIERKNGNEPWGFIIIGGKDQSLTVKVLFFAPTILLYWLFLLKAGPSY
jgi:hypothetical protein